MPTETINAGRQTILYVSLTNSSAFSPTDTMRCRCGAKMLMGTQATAALLVALVIVSRAVGAIH